MKNNNNIGQELSEFKPVELVDYEDKEAGSPRPFRSWVVHIYLTNLEFCDILTIARQSCGISQNLFTIFYIGGNLNDYTSKLCKASCRLYPTPDHGRT